MRDPKPYTMNECPVWHGTVASVHLGRVRATVEALEQERVEYAAEAQRHDETKAALLKAQRERDALLALVGQRCDGIECDPLRAEVARLAKERDEARASATRGWEQADSLHMSVAEARRERDEALRDIEALESVLRVYRSGSTGEFERRAEKAEKERDEARADYERARADFLKCIKTQRAAFADAAMDADLLRAEAARLREALTTIERTGATGATVVAQRSDGHSCSWCRGMVTPCPVVTARAALGEES